MALLFMSVIPLFLHPLCNLSIDVHISGTGPQLCLHSLLSSQAQRIQYLLSTPAGVCLMWGADMVGWAVIRNKGEMLSVLTKVGNEERAFQKYAGVGKFCPKCMFNDANS